MTSVGDIHIVSYLEKVSDLSFALQSNINSISNIAARSSAQHVWISRVKQKLRPIIDNSLNGCSTSSERRHFVSNTIPILIDMGWDDVMSEDEIQSNDIDGVAGIGGRPSFTSDDDLIQGTFLTVTGGVQGEARTPDNLTLMVNELPESVSPSGSFLNSGNKTIPNNHKISLSDGKICHQEKKQFDCIKNNIYNTYNIGGPSLENKPLINDVLQNQEVHSANNSASLCNLRTKQATTETSDSDLTGSLESCSSLGRPVSSSSDSEM